MKLEEIKKAVREGKSVYWKNPNYQVILHTFKTGKEQWLVHCTGNDSYTGLTWADGKTMNEKESDYQIEGE